MDKLQKFTTPTPIMAELAQGECIDSAFMEEQLANMNIDESNQSIFYAQDLGFCSYLDQELQEEFSDDLFRSIMTSLDWENFVSSLSDENKLKLMNKTQELLAKVRPSRTEPYEKLIKFLNEDDLFKILKESMKKIRLDVSNHLKTKGFDVIQCEQGNAYFKDTPQRCDKWTEYVGHNNELIKESKHCALSSREINPKHPNIVDEKIIPFSDESGSITIAPNCRSDLNLLQCAEELGLKFEHRMKLLRDAMLGVDEMHSQGFIHLDIKPSNIMASINSGSELKGFINDLEGMMDRQGTLSRLYVTHNYCEVSFFRKKLSEKLINPAMDVFSLGITLLETYIGHEKTVRLFTESLPNELPVFGKKSNVDWNEHMEKRKSCPMHRRETSDILNNPKHENHEQTYGECMEIWEDYLRKKVFTDTMPESMKKLILNMLRYKQEERPSIKECISIIEKTYGDFNI